LLLSHGPPKPKSDVGGVPANKKPDGDTKPSNDLALSRDRGLERGTVDLTDQIKSIPRSHIEPEQDHIQYLDQPAIRLMLEREEKEREKRPKVTLVSWIGFSKPTSTRAGEPLGRQSLNLTRAGNGQGNAP
jgi:hypothetical protein